MNRNVHRRQGGVDVLLVVAVVVVMVENNDGIQYELRCLVTEFCFCIQPSFPLERLCYIRWGVASRVPSTGAVAGLEHARYGA
jgi:hypothetical protein